MFGRLFGKYTPPLPTPPFASRKSLAGFLAAIVGGGLTTFAFWGTSVALRGERADGLSWCADRPAIFGTANAPGLLHTGWTGLRHGIAGRTWWTAAASTNGATAYLSKAAEAVSNAAGSASTAITYNSSAPSMPLWLLCIGSGLVAGVSESLEVGGLDDNLTLPIFSSVGIWAMLWSWGRVVTWLGY